MPVRVDPDSILSGGKKNPDEVDWDAYGRANPGANIGQLRNAYSFGSFDPGSQYRGGAPTQGSGSGTGVNVSSETYKPLEALQGQWNQYYSDLQNNSGRIMDQAGQRLRDAREGGRASLQQGEGIRGISSSNRLAGYESDTQRGVSSAIADVTNAREAMRGNALSQGLGIMRAPAELALQEKGLGLQAAQLDQMAQQNNFQRWLALLEAKRTSPAQQDIYSGSGASF